MRNMKPVVEAANSNLYVWRDNSGLTCERINLYRTVLYCWHIIFFYCTPTVPKFQIASRNWIKLHDIAKKTPIFDLDAEFA